MKKTNRNLKRIKFVKRLLVFVIIQVVLAVLAILVLKITSPINPSELKSATIIVDEVEYEYRIINRRMFRVFSSSNEYAFPKFPINGTTEYSMAELYTAINIGAELTVEYIEMGNQNLVIGARLNNEVLRSVDAYNKFTVTQQITSIVTFSIIELIFITILVFFVLYNCKALKLFPYKKRSQ